jgi:hypothetical protein
MTDDEQSHLSTAEVETGWLEADADVIDWLDVIAENYDLSTVEVVDRFLRYGAVNCENILDNDR